jgi:hypothetical protein
MYLDRCEVRNEVTWNKIWDSWDGIGIIPSVPGCTRILYAQNIYEYIGKAIYILSSFGLYLEVDTTYNNNNDWYALS